GLTGGQMLLNISGGSLYVGAGGMPKKAAGGTMRASFSGGILGATADFTNDVDTVLVNSAFAIQAADSVGTPHNINFTGALSGTAGFTKTGGGSLTLTNSTTSNTYTGNVTVSAGSLIGNTANLRNNIGNGGN